MDLKHAILVATILALATSSCGASASSSAGSPSAASTRRALEARLRALPPPPVAWSTAAHTLDSEDFERICPYLAGILPSEESEVVCPDGSTARLATYECEPEYAPARVRAMPCSFSLGDMVGCYLATREHPCARGERPECTAFDGCWPAGEEALP